MNEPLQTPARYLFFFESVAAAYDPVAQPGASEYSTVITGSETGAQLTGSETGTQITDSEV